MTDVLPEPTPNPAAMKFTLDRPSTEGRSQTFREESDPGDSPLGARIYSLGGITQVFMTANFVSVTKDDSEDWDDLVPRVVEAIQTHFAEG
jgi:hypothetical protein